MDKQSLQNFSNFFVNKTRWTIVLDTISLQRNLTPQEGVVISGEALALLFGIHIIIKGDNPRAANGISVKIHTYQTEHSRITEKYLLMDRFDFWHRWLMISSIILIVFGITLTLFNQTPFYDLVFNNQINPYFWGENNLDSTAIQFQRWAYGVLGATIAGWGVMVYFIVRYPFRKRKRWAWTAALAGIGLWYILDTYISIASGVFFNALFNTVVLVVFMIPLIFTRRDFLE